MTPFTASAASYENASMFKVCAGVAFGIDVSGIELFEFSGGMDDGSELLYEIVPEYPGVEYETDVNCCGCEGGCCCG